MYLHTVNKVESRQAKSLELWCEDCHFFKWTFHWIPASSTVELARMNCRRGPSDVMEKSLFINSFSVLPQDTFRVTTNDYESSPPFACAFGTPISSLFPHCNPFLFSKIQGSALFSCGWWNGNASFFEIFSRWPPKQYDLLTPSSN